MVEVTTNANGGDILTNKRNRLLFHWKDFFKENFSMINSQLRVNHREGVDHREVFFNELQNVNHTSSQKIF